MSTSTQVRLSIRRFGDYASDLLRSDMNTFSDALNVFVDFCEKDSVFSAFHAQLTSIPGVDFDEWYQGRLQTGGSFAGSCDLSFPVDQEARMALMYELLRRINSNAIGFQDFVLRFFALGKGAKITHYVQALNDAISRPLVRELGYRLEALASELPQDGSAQVSPATIQIIHQATNVIQQSASGSNINQTATLTTNPEVDRLFDRLVEAVREAHPDPDEQREQLELVEAARIEATKPESKVSIVRTLLGGLAAAGSVSEITSLILDLLA